MRILLFLFTTCLAYGQDWEAVVFPGETVVLEDQAVITVSATGFKPELGHFMIFELSQSENFEQIDHELRAQTLTWVTPELTPGLWYARVYVMRDEEVVSEVSEMIFEIAGPPQERPVLGVTCASGADHTSIDLFWTYADSDAVGFELRYTLEPDFEQTETVHLDSSQAREFLLDAGMLAGLGLETGGVIHFQIRTLFEDDSSPWSETLAVRVEPKQTRSWPLSFVPGDPKWRVFLNLWTDADAVGETALRLIYGVPSPFGVTSVRADLGMLVAGESMVLELNAWSRRTAMWLEADGPLQVSLTYSQVDADWSQNLTVPELKSNGHASMAFSLQQTPAPVLMAATRGHEPVKMDLHLRLVTTEQAGLALAELETSVEAHSEGLWIFELDKHIRKLRYRAGEPDGAMFLLVDAAMSGDTAVMGASFSPSENGWLPVFVIPN